jgi:tripartite-type tricarboxylate transporter receptor subunit TctC
MRAFFKIFGEVAVRTLASVVVAGVAAVAASMPAAAADAYPSRPITIVYPYATGSASDTLTRLVGEIITKALGQPVIVDSKPGAGGSTALEFVSKAPADGYTLVLSASGTMSVNPYVYKLRYNPVEDLVPITVLTEIPFIVVTNLDFAPKDLKEFIAYAKANPGRMTFGNAGLGTQAHLTQVLFTKAAAIDTNIVPYKGGAPAVNDLMGGHLNAMIDNAAAQVAHVQAQRVRPMFVTSRERSAALPTVPTAKEAGLDGFDTAGWFGLAAPKGTPPEIVARIQQAVAKGFAQPEIHKRLIDAGWTPVASSPDEARSRARADLERFGIAAKAIDLKPN